MRITLTMQPSGHTTIFGQPGEINQYTAGEHLIGNFGVTGQERWRFLRISNGVSREWTGDYPTADAARVVLQQNLNDRPPVVA